MENIYFEDIHKAQKAYPYIEPDNFNLSYVVHVHDELEIAFVRSGETTVIGENFMKRALSGDICVFMPGELHGFVSKADNRIFIMKAKIAESDSSHGFTSLSSVRLNKNIITAKDAAGNYTNPGTITWSSSKSIYVGSGSSSVKIEAKYADNNAWVSARAENGVTATVYFTIEETANLEVTINEGMGTYYFSDSATVKGDSLENQLYDALDDAGYDEQDYDYEDLSFSITRGSTSVGTLTLPKYDTVEDLMARLVEVSSASANAYEEMKQAAFETVVNLYSVKQNIENVFSFYKKILCDN